MLTNSLPLTKADKYVTIEGMDLKEELQAVSGRKRRFILLRILDVGTEAARQLCGISKGTYNTWLHNDAFVQLYRQIGKFATEYKQEALQLLRRANQLQAVMLEEMVVLRILEEIESGKYSLIKTNLAREVYSKLISDLDQVPQIKALTWEQRIQNLSISQGDIPRLEMQEEQDASPTTVEGEFVDVTRDQ